MNWRLLNLIAFLSLLAAFPGRGRAADPVNATPERDLVRIEREWGEALVRHDAATLSRILADEYVLTTPFGQVVTKAQLVESLQIPREDSFVLKAIEQEDFSARLYGDTAVVYSRMKLKGTAAGKEVVSPFRHTDVFVKKDGRWRCVARQATLIADPVAPADEVAGRRS